EIARENKKVVAITAAMTDGTGLTDFEKEFPDRFFDVGIAEQHAVTFAGGLAIQGLKPFVAIYSTFFQRAFDQVIHDISLQKLPVVFCLDRAGLVGEDGATHHGAFDLSYLNLIPDLIVLAPAHANEFKGMLRFAANYNEGPVVIRYSRGSAKFNNSENNPIELGKYDIRESGKKVAIMGIGKAFEDAEIIYEKLKKEFPKLAPYLVNPRFLKPMDTEFLKELTKKVKTIFTIEDNALIGGFGNSIKNYFANTDIEVFSFGIPDQFVPHGEISDLKNFIETTPEQIFEKIKAILK
ncbi:MAG: 1-deoxy-D-xylulose-5-phosphate synthase, partial [Candidatus Cloacimonetes bacterium]|nr:1-deoxy-D-xylulose-5-phosphate synthase [Candidatus Cloacimonadota bacterium]